MSVTEETVRVFASVTPGAVRFVGLMRRCEDRSLESVVDVVSDVDGRVYRVPFGLTSVLVPKGARSLLDIVEQCDAIKHLLVAKNTAYGDSALSPLRIFSKTDAVEQIKVRIDDKLSRLARGNELPDESFKDTISDLIGYLVLLRVAMSRATEG